MWLDDTRPPVELMEVSRIGFSHGSISRNFSGGTHAGFSIHTLTHDLRCGRVDLTDDRLTLDVVEHKGWILSLRNRRLWCLKDYAKEMGLDIRVQVRLWPLRRGVRILPEGYDIVRKFQKSYTSGGEHGQVLIRGPRSASQQDNDALHGKYVVQRVQDGASGEVEYKYACIKTTSATRSDAVLVFGLTRRTSWLSSQAPCLSWGDALRRLNDGDHVSLRSVHINTKERNLLGQLVVNHVVGAESGTSNSGQVKKTTPAKKNMNAIQDIILRLLAQKGASRLAIQFSKVWDWAAMFETHGTGQNTHYKPRTAQIYECIVNPDRRFWWGSYEDPVHGGSVLDWMLLAPWKLDYDFGSDHKRYDDIVNALADDSDMSSLHWANTILPKVSCLLRSCATNAMKQEEETASKNLHKYLKWVLSLGPSVVERLVTHEERSAILLCELPFDVWIGLLATDPGAMRHARMLAGRGDKDIENMVFERYCRLHMYSNFISVLIGKAGLKGPIAGIITQYLVGNDFAVGDVDDDGARSRHQASAAKKKLSFQHNMSLASTRRSGDVAAAREVMQGSLHHHGQDDAAVRDPEVAQLQADYDWADAVDDRLNGRINFTSENDEASLQVVLLAFSRCPKCLHEALENCPELRDCQQMLKENGYKSKLPTGANVFVEPWQFDAVIDALGGRELKSVHVIAHERFDSLIRGIVDELPKRHKVYFRFVEPIEEAPGDGPEAADGVLATDVRESVPYYELIRVVRTFIEIPDVPTSLFSRPSGPMTNSTTDADRRKGRNPRGSAQPK